MSKPVMATTPPKASPRPARTCQRCRTAAEQLEDRDPAGLQADEGRCGGHGSELQGGDEAREVQGQGDGG